MNTSSDQANRYAAPRAQLEDVVDDAEVGQLAGRGERLGAVLLDGLVWSLFIYVPILIGSGVNGFKTMMTSGAGKAGNPIAVYSAMWGSVLHGVTGVMVILGFMIVVGLNVYFVKKNSQSVGKKLVGIKVVRKDSSHATLGRIFWLRNIVGYYLPVLIPFIGSLYALVDCLFIFGQQRRCIHDYIADTIVVKA